jgi:hypothetical protein
VSAPEPPRAVNPSPSLAVTILLIAISAPVALVFETLLRKQVLRRILGSDLDHIRAFFSPPLTSIAWALAWVTVLAGVIGVALVPFAVRRTEAAAQKSGLDLNREAREKRALGPLFLLTSIPQVPAIFATVCFTCGALLTPVIVAMAVSTVAVLAQGYVAARLLRRLPPRGP